MANLFQVIANKILLVAVSVAITVGGLFNLNRSEEPPKSPLGLVQKSATYSAEVTSEENKDNQNPFSQLVNESQSQKAGNKSITEITATVILQPTPTINLQAVLPVTNTTESPTPTPTYPLIQTTTSIPTLPPTVTESPTPTPDPIKKVLLHPEGEDYVTASGYANIQKVTHRPSGYNEYRVWGEIIKFFIGLPIKVYLCSARSCVSSAGLQVSRKNDDGYYSFDGKVSLYDDTDSELSLAYSKVSMIKVWEVTTSRNVNHPCAFNGFDPDPSESACLRGDY